MDELMKEVEASKVAVTAAKDHLTKVKRRVEKARHAADAAVDKSTVASVQLTSSTSRLVEVAAPSAPLVVHDAVLGDKPGLKYDPSLLPPQLAPGASTEMAFCTRPPLGCSFTVSDGSGCLSNVALRVRGRTQLAVQFNVLSAKAATMLPLLPIDGTSSSTCSENRCCACTPCSEGSDFIGLYSGSTSSLGPCWPSRDHFAVEYTNGSTSGALSFTAPTLAGCYHFCYMHHSNVVCAVSSAFWVDNADASTECLTAPRESKELRSPAWTTTSAGTSGNAEAAELALPASILAPAPPLSPAHTHSTSPGHTSDVLPSQKTALAALSAGASLTGMQASASPPSAAPALAPLTPMFCLEKYLKIEAFQLLIHLPYRIAITDAHSDGEGKGSPDRVSAPAFRLPAHWRPGLHLLGDRQSLVRVEFTLPALPTVGVGAEPTQVFALELELGTRLDWSTVTMLVAADHISVRLPVFFSGSSLPTRPKTMITAAEVYALRQPTRRVLCKFCRNPLMHHHTLPKADKAVNETATALRHSVGEASKWISPGVRSLAHGAFVLPSQDWLEWSDFWMCHNDERNVYIPEKDYGAHRDTILIDETSLRLHPADVLPSHGGVSVSALAAPERCSRLSYELTCGRCEALVGRLWQPHSQVSHFEPVSMRDWGDTAWASALPDRLSADSDPTVELFKVALFVPKHGAATNVFQHHALFSSVAFQMLTACLTESVYRFVLTSPSSTASLHIHVVNWNVSVRGSVEAYSMDSAPCLKVRYRVEDTAPRAKAAPTSHVPADCEHGSHATCHSTSERMDEHGAGTEGLVGGSRPFVCSLDQCVAVNNILEATQALLPPALRRDGAFQVAYLPFLNTT